MRFVSVTRRQAQKISRGLLRKLGPAHRGRWVAIEERTGTPYLGDSSLRAVQAGLRKHPRGQFYIERLGAPIAGMLKRARFR